jgi:hypothetical protein
MQTREYELYTREYKKGFRGAAVRAPPLYRIKLRPVTVRPTTVTSPSRPETGASHVTLDYTYTPLNEDTPCKQKSPNEGTEILHKPRQPKREPGARASWIHPAT